MRGGARASQGLPLYAALCAYCLYSALARRVDLRFLRILSINCRWLCNSKFHPSAPAVDLSCEHRCALSLLSIVFPLSIEQEPVIASPYVHQGLVTLSLCSNSNKHLNQTTFFRKSQEDRLAGNFTSLPTSTSHFAHWSPAPCA